MRRIHPVVAFHSNPLPLSESLPPPHPSPHRCRWHRRRCCCWSAAPFCAKMFNFFATVKIFGWLTQPISNESSRHAAWAGVLALWVVAVVQWLVGICTSYGNMYVCVCVYKYNVVVVVVLGLLSTTVDYEMCVASAWLRPAPG